MVVEYTDLVDATEANCSYNFYGVLLNFTRIIEVSNKKKKPPPHKYYISYTIVDPSRPPPSSSDDDSFAASVVVNIFANDIASLVQPTHVGAVMRFHDVRLSAAMFGPWHKTVFVGSMANRVGTDKGSFVVLFERCTDPLTGLPLMSTKSGTGYKSINRIDDSSFEARQWTIRTSADSTNHNSPNESSPPRPFSPDQVVAGRLMSLTAWAEGQFLVHVELQRCVHARSQQIARSLFDISCNSNTAAADAETEVSKDGAFDCVCMLVALQDSPVTEIEQDTNAGPGPGCGRRVSLFVYDGTGPDLHESVSVHASAAAALVDRVRDVASPSRCPSLGPCLGPSPSVSVISAPSAALVGPLFGVPSVQRVFQGLKNAALFSECTSVLAKHALDSTLESALAPSLPLLSSGASDSASAAPVPNLFGQLYRINCDTNSDCDYVTQTLRLQPGMWLRIRGLHACTEEAKFQSSSTKNDNVDRSCGSSNEVPCVGKLCSDTAVGALLPYFRDVSAIAANYFRRLVELQRQLQRQRDREAATTSVLQMGDSSAFDEFCPLSLCLSSVPPAVFRCRVRVIDFYPRKVCDFVRRQDSSVPVITAAAASKRGARVRVRVSDRVRVKTQSIVKTGRVNNAATKKGQGQGQGTAVYMFSLRVADASGTADVICFGKEAQFLLGGITASVFQEKAGVRRAVSDALEQCIASGLLINMNFWSYKLPVRVQEAGIAAVISSVPGDAAQAQSGVVGVNEGTGAKKRNGRQQHRHRQEQEQEHKEERRYAETHQYQTRLKIVHTQLITFASFK